jgi:hypothetical protein
MCLLDGTQVVCFSCRRRCCVFSKIVPVAVAGVCKISLEKLLE